LGLRPHRLFFFRRKTEKVRAGFSYTRIGFALAEPEPNQRSFAELAGGERSGAMLRRNGFVLSCPVLITDFTNCSADE
jgi:hypothetical protein